MVAATGIRILGGVDFRHNRHNLYSVAISLGAPRWTQHMAHSLHPLLQSGILLTAISAVRLSMAADLPAELRARIARVAEDIAAGRIHVPEAYDGPEFATPA